MDECYSSSEFFGHLRFSKTFQKLVFIICGRLDFSGFLEFIIFLGLDFGKPIWAGKDKLKESASHHLYSK